MRKRFGMDYEDKEAFSPWETYSDLYCGLLLVFVLLFFFAVYQYIDAREKNNADTAALQAEMKDEQASVLALYKADLEDQEAAYQEKSQELETQKTALAILRADLEGQQLVMNDQQTLLTEQSSQLEEQQGLLKEQQSQLKEQQGQLEEQRGRLEEQSSQLEEQQGLLKEQQSRLKEQEALLGTQQELLDSQAQQIEQIVGVRGQLIEELNRELSAHQIQIQADQTTGAIAFDSEILFAPDSNELSEEGKAFFRRFMPVYLNALLQPEFREYISEIIIEGHTDNVGTYLHNLELSQQRAWSVAEYILSEENAVLDQDLTADLESLVTVNGCSYKALIYREDGTVDAEKSRRVEIKFRLTDQEMIQEMDEILNK